MTDGNHQAAFSKACSLFDARVVDAMRLLLKKKQWFAAAMVCCSAIDVLADAHEPTKYVEKEDYVKAIERFFPSTYGRTREWAETFYSALRSGLIHRAQLVPRNESARRGPPAPDVVLVQLGRGGKGPREALYANGQIYLIVDVPHLVEEFEKLYADFKGKPTGRAQRRFAERLNQTEFVEVEIETERGTDRKVLQWPGEVGSANTFASTPTSGALVSLNVDYPWP